MKCAYSPPYQLFFIYIDVFQVNLRYFFKTLIFRSCARSNMRRFRGSPFRRDNHEMSLVTTLPTILIYIDVFQVNLSYFFKTFIFRSRARSNMRRFRGYPFRRGYHEMSLVTTLPTILYLYLCVSDQFELLFENSYFFAPVHDLICADFRDLCLGGITMK